MQITLMVTLMLMPVLMVMMGLTVYGIILLELTMTVVGVCSETKKFPEATSWLRAGPHATHTRATAPPPRADPLSRRGP